MAALRMWKHRRCPVRHLVRREGPCAESGRQLDDERRRQAAQQRHRFQPSSLRPCSCFIMQHTVFL